MNIIKIEGGRYPEYTTDNNSISDHTLKTLNKFLVAHFKDIFRPYMETDSVYPMTTTYALRCASADALLPMISDYFKELEIILGKSPLVVRVYPYVREVTYDDSSKAFEIYARLGTYEGGRWAEL